MVDLEPFLEAPFEEASNVSFEALLLLGIGLLAAVAALGRSTVTMAAVAVYLCLLPAYVGFRVRVWDRDEAEDDGTADADDGSTVDGAASDECETDRPSDSERDDEPGSAGEINPDGGDAGADEASGEGDDADG